MKRHDQSAFIVFTLLCGLTLLLSCSTSRHAETAATIETRDTTRIHSLDSTTTAEEIHRGEVRDTVQKGEHITGSLKIERDTAGRPVLYIWDTSALMRTATVQEYEFAGLSIGRGHYRATDTTTTTAEDIQKEEKKATKVGAPLEDYIGVGLILFVILYVIYVIIENLWRNRNK